MPRKFADLSEYRDFDVLGRKTGRYLLRCHASGHEFWRSPGSFRKCPTCPECTRETRNEVLKAELTAMGFSPAGPLPESITHVSDLVCSAGHHLRKSLAYLRRSPTCRDCRKAKSVKKRPRTQAAQDGTVFDRAGFRAAVEAELAVAGWSVLQHGDTTHEPLTVRCAGGHVVKRSLQYLRAHSTCSQCVRAEKRTQRSAFESDKRASLEIRPAADEGQPEPQRRPLTPDEQRQQRQLRRRRRRAAAGLPTRREKEAAAAQKRTQVLRSWLDSVGFTLLTDIQPACPLVDIACRNGHTLKRKVHALQHREIPECPKCLDAQRLELVREYADKRGLTITDYDGKYDPRTPGGVVHARCAKGHPIEATFQYAETGLWCTTCNGSFAEDQLAQQVEAATGRVLTRNDRSLIGPQELDIYDPVSRIAVEYCGLYWHSEGMPGITRDSHADKLYKCQQVGIRLLTVFEDEWLARPHVVLDRIRHAMNLQGEKLNARALRVAPVSTIDARSFFDANHIQGWGRSSYAVGLWRGSELIQCMSFGALSRAHTGSAGTVEMRRLASKLGTVVRGGAARLLAHAVPQLRTEGYTSIKSYCDLRYGTGNVYKQLGFVLDRTSKPSYWYFQPPSSRRFSAMSKRKTSEERASGLTEYELRKAEGYRRIWDCGHQSWTLAI